MKNDKEEYYVYVYIDPRNFEEFYYGKGKGSRKEAHLSEDSDSDKSKQIKDIKKEGLKPTIKVIARNLTEAQALLVEKTLIWKLGKNLTNKSGGHYADNFRPHNTFHIDISGYDFKNGVYLVNVGEGEYRCWEDCKQFNFLSAGQGKKGSDQIRTLESGDFVIAYLKSCGYVGVGRVEEKAVCINDFRYNNKSLRELPLRVKNMFKNCDNENSEYLIKVNWNKTVDRKDAKWKKNSGLFATQLVRASLRVQLETLEFVQRQFDVNIIDILKQD
jgi:hypothetical protein